jgi:hypothetical protein
MATLTAAILIAENGFQNTDFDPAGSSEDTGKTNVEYMIDSAIDYVNLEAETSISNLSGSAGSKTVTVTASQNAVLKLLLTAMLREAKFKGSSSLGMGGLSVSDTLVTQPPIFQSLFKNALRRLRGMDFKRT